MKKIIVLHNMSRILLTFCISLLLAFTSYAGVIGDWEGTNTDGWISWGDSQKSIGDSSIMPSEYSFNTSWSTLGSQSIMITHSGWKQTLSLKLENQAGGRADFLANSKLEFDWAVPNIGWAGGWSKIENVVLNASGFGWQNLPSSTFQINFWAGSGMLSKHIVIDYSAAKALVMATATTGYIELIITTNNDSINNVMYFDNMRLTGASLVTVPNVVGMTQTNAVAAVTSAGLVVGTTSQQCNDSVVADNVISQEPASDTQVNIGSAVNLVISSGQPSVPDVTGQAEAGAIAAINAVANISYGSSTSYCSDTVAAGNVISQSSIGTVSCGSIVNLVISTGQPSVPDVTGQTETDAIAAINAVANISYGSSTSYCSDTVAAGNVISQSSIGTVSCGSIVNLVISTGQHCLVVPNVVGMTRAEAEAAIISAGLVVGTIGNEFSNTIPVGSVSSQNPIAGTEVLTGSSVNMGISLGSLTVSRPTIPGSIVGWGMNPNSQLTPPDGNDYVAIAAGSTHSLALKSDGSIVGWGDNQFGQATPPAGNNYVAITAGAGDSLALKSDGSIVGWGYNYYGQATPPAGNNYVAIAAGNTHSLALKSDGSIVAWGDNGAGQATPPAGNNFIAIAAGAAHSLALKSDGSIVGWGFNVFGQATPPDGNDYVAIAAGKAHSLALKTDGSIVGWGWNTNGLLTPPAGNDYVAIAAGNTHSLALKSDGSIVGWGDNSYGQATPPDGSNFIAIAAGYHYSSLAIRREPQEAQLPDLEVNSEDINFVPLPGEPCQPVTISATIWNVGAVAAENVVVILKDFDNQIGDPCVIPILEPNQSATVSMQYTWSASGFHLITVVADPNNTISETDKTNNTASKLYQVGSVPDMNASIEILYDAPSGFTEGSVASICGNANYKIFISGGSDVVYPVKGGLVSAQIKDSNGIVLQILPSRYTDADGRFNISFVVPGKAGDTFTLDVNVTDCTLTGSQNRTFNVTQIPIPPPIRDFWLGGMALDNESPEVNDIVRIEATVYADLNNNSTEYNIPVTFYASNQSLGGQAQVIGSTQNITQLQRGESNSLSVQWILTTEGVYVITAELGPGFSDDYNWNNSTSISVVVGIFMVSANPYWAKAGDIVQITIDSKWPLPSDSLENVTVKDSSGNDILQDANVVHIPGSTRWIYQTTALTETMATGMASILVTGTDSNGTHTGYGNFYIYSQSQPIPDLSLNTCDVNVSKINPALGETISIGATVHADNTMDVNNVPVTFYADPSGDYKIGSTQVIPKITQGGEGSVSIVWTNAATGIYEIEVSLGPGFSDRYSGNNTATRAVVVGEPNVPFDAEFVVVNKRRVGRTIFDYDCKVSLKNTSRLNVRVLQCELVAVPNNISVTDSYVSDFEDFGPEETKTSADTCTFRVDRSEPINVAQVNWKVTYEIINACPPLQQMSHSMVNLEPQGINSGDITGDGKVDYDDLAILAEQWLKPPSTPSADIAPLPNGDGIVNFLDFAVLAKNWLQ